MFRVMRTVEEMVNLSPLPAKKFIHIFMKNFYILFLIISTGHPRLIGHYDQFETCFAEHPKGLRDARKKHEIFGSVKIVHLFVQCPVAV
jgi:hypothetical protein